MTLQFVLRTGAGGQGYNPLKAFDLDAFCDAYISLIQCIATQNASILNTSTVTQITKNIEAFRWQNQ